MRNAASPDIYDNNIASKPPHNQIQSAQARSIIFLSMQMKVANNLAEIFSLLLSEHQDEFFKPALFRTGLKKQKDLNYACGIQIYIHKEMFKSSLCAHQTR